MVKTIDEFFKGYLPLKTELKPNELYVADTPEVKPLLYIGKERMTVDYDCDDGNICSD